MTMKSKSGKCIENGVKEMKKKRKIAAVWHNKLWQNQKRNKKRQQVVEQGRKLLGIPFMDQPISLLPLQKLVVRMPFPSACSSISFQTLPRS